MSKKWITILVAAVIGALLLPSAAFAACRLQVVTAVAYTDGTDATKSGADPLPYVAGDKITLVTPTLDGGTGLTVNAEGVSERVADLLISDDLAAPFCFTAGNDLVITYNAILTSPPTPGNLAIPGNLDIFDSNGIGGLTVTSATVSQVFAANTTNSQLDIHIGQTGTAGDLEAGPNGAAIRVKNVRVNASLTTGTVSATFLGNFGTVATLNATIGATTQPTAPVQGVAVDGTQSSGKGLAHSQTIAMTEGFGTAFRTKGGTCNSRTASSDTCYSQVANDIATVATSMVFTVTGIPSGVTVTFPSSMSTSALANSSNSMTFGSRGGASVTNSGAPGNLTAIYDTSKNGAAANTLTIKTADNADSGTKGAAGGASASNTNPNCKDDGTGVLEDLNSGSPCDQTPKIGVKVGTTSLSGTAKLWWAFGPADVGGSLFTGDDVAADTTVIPRYTGDARLIVDNEKFFTIFPTRTTLLFPFVSSAGGWNTGLEIGNTGGDAGVFDDTASSQTGGITFFFFGTNPSTGAVVKDSVNSDTTSGGVDLSSACRGLDASGRVAAGQTAACVLTNLLAKLPTAPTAFDGYVIAVGGFNFGHGFSVVFNAAGAPFAANNALVLGLNGATARVGTESLGQ